LAKIVPLKNNDRKTSGGFGTQIRVESFDFPADVPLQNSMASQQSGALLLGAGTTLVCTKEKFGIQ